MFCMGVHGVISLTALGQTAPGPVNDYVMSQADNPSLIGCTTVAWVNRCTASAVAACAYHRMVSIPTCVGDNLAGDDHAAHMLPEEQTITLRSNWSCIAVLGQIALRHLREESSTCHTMGAVGTHAYCTVGALCLQRWWQCATERSA